LDPIFVIAIVVLATAMAVSVGVLIYMAVKIYRVHKEISEFLTATRAELFPALQQMQRALGEVDSAAHDARLRLERADKILGAVERLIDGTTLAIAMSRTFKASGGTMTGLIEGIREGLRTLRKPTKDREEEAK